MISAGNLTLQAVGFDSCSAEESGGALHSTAEGYTTSTGCTFSNNEVSHQTSRMSSACTAAVTTVGAVL